MINTFCNTQELTDVQSILDNERAAHRITQKSLGLFDTTVTKIQSIMYASNWKIYLFIYNSVTLPIKSPPNTVLLNRARLMLYNLKFP